MERARDAIPWSVWVNDRSVVESVRERRKFMLFDLAKSNGKESVDDLLSDMFLDKTTPYAAALAYVNSLRDRELAPGTIAQYRSMLPGFFKNALGEENFSQVVYDNRVPKGDTFTVTIKKAPTKEELTHMLSIANLRDRALLGVLCTGMRISEFVSRRVGEIKPGKNGKDYYRLVLKPGETKMRYRRWVPLTAETMKWIKDYHESLGKFKSEWVFPGDVRPKGGKKNRENHLTIQGAYVAIKDLFIKAGLVDVGDEIYSPHSFRKFAENFMIRCGLGEKFVGTIIGHAGPLGRAYKDEDDNETTESWFDICADKMTWLENKIEIVKRDKQLEALQEENVEIRDILRALVMAQRAQLAPHEDHRPAEEVKRLMELANRLEEKKRDRE